MCSASPTTFAPNWRTRFAGKVKPERLAITATHTHTGPMLKGANVTLFGTPIPKEHLANIDKYTVEFLDKLEKAGLDALAKREPAKLSYAIGNGDVREESPHRRRAGRSRFAGACSFTMPTARRCVRSTRATPATA